MTRNSSSKRRRRPPRSSNTLGQQPRFNVGRELVARPAPIPMLPPKLDITPGMAKTVRLVVPGTGSPIPLFPRILSQQDQADYGSSSIRWNTLRVIGARVWYDQQAATTDALSVTVLSIGAANNTSTGTNPPVLTLAIDQTTAVSGISVGITTRMPGVAWKWGLVDRGTILQAGNGVTELFILSAYGSSLDAICDVDVVFSA